MIFDNPELKHPPARIHSQSSYIVYDFQVSYRRETLSPTSDLTTDYSHISISTAINDGLTKEPIFIEHGDPEVLIKEFMTKLIHRPEIISRAVWKTYLMKNIDSLPERVQSGWMTWVNQVPVFCFNSGKYDLNLVKYYFVRAKSDMSNVNVVKKDDSSMLLITPWFKFLDLRNYLALSLKVHSLSPGKVAATPILKSVPSQFSPFIL